MKPTSSVEISNTMVSFMWWTKFKSGSLVGRLSQLFVVALGTYYQWIAVSMKIGQGLESCYKVGGRFPIIVGGVYSTFAFFTLTPVLIWLSIRISKEGKNAEPIDRVLQVLSILCLNLLLAGGAVWAVLLVSPFAQLVVR